MVRLARLADMDALLAMGEHMHAEGAYAFLPYEREKVRRRVTVYIEGGDERCLLVAESGGALTGMLAGYLDTYFFCEERLAHDVFFFVVPAHRGGLSALRLIETFAAWAEDRGARELCLGISSGVRTEKIEQFYRKLGMTRAGSIYKLRLS